MATQNPACGCGTDRSVVGMTEPAGGGWCAYVDESGSNPSLDPDTYVLAAACLPESSHEPARDLLRALRLTPAGKLHWYNETATRRRKLVEQLCGLEALHLVVVRSGLPGERPERRRRHCLTRLLHELDQAGIAQVSCEARQRKQNQQDRELVNMARSQHAISQRLRIDHMPGPAEPLLWLPDIICGAVVADRCGHGEYLTSLRHLVETHHIGP